MGFRSSGDNDISYPSGLLSDAREKVRSFINAEKTEEVIFTKNTTESINLIAYSYGLEFINEGDEIILGISNHHANIVPWQFVAKKKNAGIKFVYLDDNGQFDINDFKNKLSEKTKIVAVSAVVNVTGVIQPVEEIVKLAHEYGALAVIDAAQSILHYKHDVQKMDARLYPNHGQGRPLSNIWPLGSLQGRHVPTNGHGRRRNASLAANELPTPHDDL